MGLIHRSIREENEQPAWQLTAQEEGGQERGEAVPIPIYLTSEPINIIF